MTILNFTCGQAYLYTWAAVIRMDYEELTDLFSVSWGYYHQGGTLHKDCPPVHLRGCLCWCLNIIGDYTSFAGLSVHQHII